MASNRLERRSNSGCDWDKRHVTRDDEPVIEMVYRKLKKGYDHRLSHFQYCASPSRLLHYFCFIVLGLKGKLKVDDKVVDLEGEDGAKSIKIEAGGT